jgi:hypothetical protein
MTSVRHEQPAGFLERHVWPLNAVAPEAWAGLAIIVIWLAVLFDAVFGPDIVNSSAGGDSSSVPSAVAIAIFAFFATWVVARYGFHRDRKE